MWEERYRHLIGNVRTHLLYPLLGKSYYNTNIDIIGHDEEIVKDIKNKIDDIKFTCVILKYLLLISVLFNCIQLII